MTVLDLSPPRPTVPWKAVIPIVFLLVVTCVGVLGLSLIPQSDRGQFAVVFRPDMTLEQISDSVARAKGKIVREGAFKSLVIAHFDDPGFEPRLKKGGALFVLNPTIVGGS